MAITSPRASFYRVAPPVPLDWEDEKEHRRKIAEAVEMALNGRIRSTGQITLTESTTTTTLSDTRIAAQSRILLTATTSNAAGAVGTTYVSSKIDGSAVFTHANNAQTDRTFDYFIVG